MAARTTSARLDALEALVAGMPAAIVAALAPATSAPATAKAEAPFMTFLRAKAAAKVACTLHPALADGTVICARKFSPASKGTTNHVARLV